MAASPIPPIQDQAVSIFDWLRSWASWIIAGIGVAWGGIKIFGDRSKESALNDALHKADRESIASLRERINGFDLWRDSLSRDHAILMAWREAMVNEHATLLSSIARKPDRSEVQEWFESLREDIRSMSGRAPRD